MSNYTPLTNFGAKDTLPSGNAAKVVRGSEFTTEFNSIASSIATKAEINAPLFTSDATFGGNIIVSGTVDGRDVAADGTKLDTIETSATADQTDAEIRTLVESASDSNVFTDADHTKLNAIEASADVTDATNVTAAGAAMLTGASFTGAVNFSDDVAVNTNTLFVDVSEAKVGIGTTSPDSLMHLSANTGATLTLESTDTAIATNEVIGEIDFYSNDASGIGAASRGSISLIAQDAAGAGSMLFKTSNASTASEEHMRIDASGNVGIGTDSPIFPSGYSGLQVNGGIASQLRLTNSTTGATATDGLAVSNDVSASYLWNYEATPLILATSSAERLRIDASGNVGIGTSSPSQLLTISGNDPDFSQEMPSTSTSNLIQHLFRVDGVDEGQVVYDKTSGSETFQLRTTKDIAFLTGGSAERMRIDSSGNVGIGEANPTQKLQVDGNIRLGDTAIGVDDDEDYNITTGGQLTIHANDSGENVDYISLNLSCGNSSGSQNEYSRISCFVNDDEKMRIDASGNVGIGTGSPNGKLHVAGNGKFDGGTSTVLDVLCDDGGTATINLMGGNQGTGVLYVGQSSTHGGGIEYNGDGVPATSGGGSDQIVLYRRSGSTNEWTARNSHSDNNWNFRGSVTQNASDERLKENITPIENALEKVEQLRGVEFDWKDDVEEKGFIPYAKHETGVIAQDVQKVIPDAAVPAPFDENYLTVKHEKIIPLLIESIKELNKEVQSLHSRVAELENV